MEEKKCRVCGNKFFSEPLLHYENMPAAAQHLPTADSLENDKGVALEVCQCSGCGLVQLNNDPVSYYREVIRAAAVSAAMREFRQKQFSDFIAKYALQGKKIVEIGCGGGEYLSIMQQAGVNAYGLEFAPAAVAECVKKGLKVSQGFIEDRAAKIADAPFDAFFILNFIEHLPDINDALAGIGNNLVEDGVGIVEVPNFDMILRQKLFAEFIPDHLYYFTQATLHTALALNGYDILESSAIWHEYIISAVVRKRRKLELAEFDAHKTNFEKELMGFIGRHQSVAVWGAGHQALAIISLLKLADKIKYVIDSAAFKQGKFTPASHLPIVAPETIISSPVEAIIVMAGGYSDEVAAEIKQKYGQNIKVAVIRYYRLENA